MKTVIEKIDGKVYVYVNSEKHFARIAVNLSGEQFGSKDLAQECDLMYYPDNCHFIIEGKPYDT